MDDWYTKGCGECRQGVLSSQWPPPKRIGVIGDLHVFVHRCDKCRAYWIFNEREAHVISDAEAASLLERIGRYVD